MQRLLSFLALFCFFLCSSSPAGAWDKVTHSAITDMAVDFVQTPELAALLRAHRSELLSGAWFPDWAQYGHPFDDGNHRSHLDRFRAYLHRPGVQARSDYPALVAYYLGTYGHCAEDFYVDTTLEPFLESIDRHVARDTEYGMLNIQEFQYLNLHVVPYLPINDLIAIYQSGGYFQKYHRDPANFGYEIRTVMKRQYILMRELKLLSFLSSQYTRSLMPWASQHMMTAPGGLEDEARATAAIWEALWADLHDKPAPFFVYSTPLNGGSLFTPDNTSPYGRITLLSWHRMDNNRFDSDSMTLTDADRTVISGHTQLGYVHSPVEASDLVVQFTPDTSLTPGHAYMLTVNPGVYGLSGERLDTTYQIHFMAPDTPKIRSPHPERGWAMGVFGLCFFAPLALIVAGGSGLVRLQIDCSPHGLLARKRGLATGVQRSLEIAGLVLLGIGLYFLLTNGLAIINYGRFAPHNG
jgi:hypothetical protein